MQWTESAIRRFSSIAVKLFILLSTIYWLIPALRKPLVREDNLLEMITALLFLATAVLSVTYLLKRANGPRHWSDWCVPVLATLGFLEEVSFGRLFFDQLPIVQGVKIDALHDYLRVVVNLVNSGEYNGLIQTGAVGALVLVAGIVWLARQEIILLSRRLSIRFCTICLVLVAAASVLDLELVQHHYLHFLEEFTETLAAYALWLAYRSLAHTNEALSPNDIAPLKIGLTDRGNKTKRATLDAQAH